MYVFRGWLLPKYSLRGKHLNSFIWNKRHFFTGAGGRKGRERGRASAATNSRQVTNGKWNVAAKPKKWLLAGCFTPWMTSRATQYWKESANVGGRSASAAGFHAVGIAGHWCAAGVNCLRGRWRQFNDSVSRSGKMFVASCALFDRSFDGRDGPIAQLHAGPIPVVIVGGRVRDVSRRDRW